MEFKSMNNSELASVMVNYITRVAHLERMIGNYLESADQCSIPERRIKDEYAKLKNELREDAYYLSLIRNRSNGILYMGAFSPSIREAAAFGFRVPINHRVDFKMFTTVSDAHYRLTKYKDLEEWGELI